MSDRLHVLHVASWFPSEVHPSLGNFVERHIDAINTRHDAEVWAPIPVRGSTGQLHKMRAHNGEERRTLGQVEWTVRRGYHEATRPQLLGVARSLAGCAGGMERTPDLVHLHVAYPAGPAALAWAKKWKVPVVLTEHWTAYHAPSSLPWWRRRVVKDVLRNVDACCPVTSHLGRAMTQWGVPQEAIHVVPNVVDTQRFQPAPMETLSGVPVGQARRKMEGHGVEKLLHVSSMDDGQKNISGLLEALVPTLEKRPRWTATFVGGETANLGAFQASVKAKGMGERITFTGPLSSEEVAGQMQQHDVLMLNSRIENFPCVLPEAWATGLPVMSTDVGGISEHLPKGLGPRGFLLGPQASAEEWDAAWTQVAAAKWDVKAMRDYASEHFSVAAVARAYDQVYRQVLKA